MADCLPTFNPEVWAGRKAEVGLDQLFHWANAIAGARGTIQGVNEALRAKYGQKLAEMTEDEELLAEVMKEMIAKMKEGMTV